MNARPQELCRGGMAEAVEMDAVGRLRAAREMAERTGQRAGTPRAAVDCWEDQILIVVRRAEP
jgi:hypothetical protein